MINLIALAGKAHSGKSSLAGMLLNELNWHAYRYSAYAFAGPIKRTINKLFGWDERHSEGELKEVVDPKWGFSPRTAYQKFGTDFGRKMLRDDIWLKCAELATQNKNIIITDLRFENEVEWVRRQGGLIVHVHRSGQFGIASGHESEKGIGVNFARDYITPACSDLEELQAQAHIIVSIIKHGRESV